MWTAILVVTFHHSMPEYNSHDRMIVDPNTGRILVDEIPFVDAADQDESLREMGRLRHRLFMENSKPALLQSSLESCSFLSALIQETTKDMQDKCLEAQGDRG